MERPIVLTPTMGVLTAADFREREPDLAVREPDDPVTGLDRTDGSKAVVVSNQTWTDAYLDHLSAGDWVTSIGAGYDSVAVDALSEAGVAFTHCPGINSEQVAEHAFATAFSMTRCLETYREQQRAHEWEKHHAQMTDLAGDACCVVGLGNVGEAVATRASAFGMTVRGVKRSTEGYDGAADAVYGPGTLREAVSGARLLVLAVPLTEATRNLIGEAELGALADDAVVVNVARGAVLDTAALLDALDDLRGACLDVTDPEPLPADHPLWDRDDVLVTPHCAGFSEKYADRFLDLFLEQYDRWRSEGELRHRVV